MNNRWSLALILVFAVLVGSAVPGPPAGAQTQPLPFAVGETVTLYYGEQSSQPSFGTSVECVVAELRGEFVRCAAPRARIGGSADRVERWLTLKYVVQITKRVE